MPCDPGGPELKRRRSRCVIARNANMPALERTGLVLRKLQLKVRQRESRDRNTETEKKNVCVCERMWQKPLLKPCKAPHPRLCCCNLQVRELITSGEKHQQTARQLAPGFIRKPRSCASALWHMQLRDLNTIVRPDPRDLIPASSLVMMQRDLSAALRPFYSAWMNSFCRLS